MSPKLQETIAAIEDPAYATLEAAVRNRLDSLTKPRGSLGRLEELALWYAVCRGESLPAEPQKGLVVFCGDHGVTAEGVSAYPAEVTAQMAANFANGGAAINVLCNRLGIAAIVVDVGIAAPLPAGLNVVARKVEPGTANFAVQPAMTEDQLDKALAAGLEMAGALADRGVTLAATGEMGIGNTTAAAALGAMLTGLPSEALAGPGAGLSADGVAAKLTVLERALALHGTGPRDPLYALARVGGFEIAAMTGFYLGCATLRIPVMVDGFIATAAALAAARLAPHARPYFGFAHRSAEPGHQRLLEALDAQPVLDLGMRLGEGTGAALAMAVVDSAVALYREMATFESAGVSDR